MAQSAGWPAGDVLYPEPSSLLEDIVCYSDGGDDPQCYALSIYQDDERLHNIWRIHLPNHGHRMSLRYSASGRGATTRVRLAGFL